MSFVLSELLPHEMEQFKTDIQEAFQKGFEDVYGKTEDIILPEREMVTTAKKTGWEKVQ